ncbi:MAG: hypothetical protein CVU45_04290 [Chloroflexi bacterium HGW-Chloroflexi-7]|nr:MAG: hypothetical protein CVU45_04290 [Chloroflexi bacterium HGW-Chloroflexi-7]
MSLTNILILVGFSLVIFIFSKFDRTRKFRNPLLLVFSTGVIFWLQPALPIRGLDFWLPVATLTLVGLGWLMTSKAEERSPRESLITGGLVVGTVVVIALTRYLGMTGIITPSRPPQTLNILMVLMVMCAILFLSYKHMKGKTAFPYVAGLFILLVIFAALKLPVLAEWLSEVLRGMSRQSRELASALDLRWLVSATSPFA